MVLPFVDSTHLCLERAMTGASGNWYCGLHEPAEMGLVLHGLRPEGLFVDVGANVGSYTILSAGAVGANVISIEPIPQTFARLRANVNLNDLQRKVELLNIGISDQNGFLNFTESLDTMNRVALPDEQLNSISVPVRTLDDVMQGRSADMIKIDVEGHELAVLRGATNTLRDSRLKAVVMETNNSGRKYGVNGEELIQEMETHGFLAYTYDPLKRDFQRASSMSLGNSIFLRDPILVRQICRTAKTFSLLNGPI